MAIAFPSGGNVTIGQQFTSEGRTFEWNGTVWVMLGLPIPFATEAEALAGVATDRVLSPLTAQAIIDTLPPGGSPFEGEGTLPAGRALDTVYESPYDRTMLLTIGGPISILIEGGPTAGSLIPLGRRSRYDGTSPDNGCIALIPPRWFYKVTSTTTSPTVDRWREFTT